MAQNRNIPQGYKQTAVGVIPQEWKVRTFQELGSMLGTNTLSRDKMNECSGCAQNIHYGDVLVKYGEVLDCTSMNIPWVNSDCGNANLGTNLQNGDIVISDTAEDYTVGKATEVQGVGTKIVLSGLHTIAFRPNVGMFASNFLGYYFNSTIYRAQLYPLIQGIKVCSISKKAISNTKLAVPPLAEQRQIAEILGVWDEAIEKQSRLIEKLELRKRGLMQRLLTGRTRLSGFNTPWKKVKLGEIGRFISGCVFNENEQGGKVGFPFFKVSDMNLCGNEVRMTKSNNYVTQEQIERLNYIVIKDEAIIFAKVGAAIALERKRYAKDFIIDNNMLAYVPDTNIWYMKYWFDSIKLSKYIQVGALPSYNASDLAIIKLNLPSLSEQKTIAEVLTAADNEIATHRKKLDALRLQKRGLMQQLLTGKTRVKI